MDARTRWSSPFGMDIGGTLSKLMYREEETFPDNLTGFLDNKYLSDFIGDHADDSLTISCELGKLRFVCFETKKMDSFLDSVIENDLLQSFGGERVIHVTGGGAFKFEELFKRRLSMTIIKMDEMLCLVTGLNYALRHFPDEVFVYNAPAGMRAPPNFVCPLPSNFVTLPENFFPYLFVNIGSGVSVLLVDGPNSYRRVSGSPIGGATFWGLFRLITRSSDSIDFRAALNMAARGDNTQADMLVGDIYGDHDYSRIGLTKDVIASCFGKMVMKSTDTFDSLRPEDMALALLKMVSFNIGQIAYLNACRFNVKRVFFAGNFIQGYSTTMTSLSFAINYYSGGDMQALFLRHEGFYGALGAFLEQVPGLTVCPPPPPPPAPAPTTTTAPLGPPLDFAVIPSPRPASCSTPPFPPAFTLARAPPVD